MLQRSPTSTAVVPGENPVGGAVQRLLPDKGAGAAVRWAHDLGAQALYELSQRYPNPVRRLLRFDVRVQLPRGYDIDTHFSPHYDPWDERMCAVPGGDLFKAIESGQDRKSTRLELQSTMRTTNAVIRLQTNNKHEQQHKSAAQT